MVLSKINKEVSYPELKKVEEDDLKREASLYEIEVKGEDVVIAIGAPKFTFEKKGLVFFPIYLVKHNHKAIQIGIYEVEKAKHMSYYIDAGEGELDVDLLDDPLIYHYVTKEMIHSVRLIPPKDSESDSDSGSESESDEEEEKEEKKVQYIEADDSVIPEERRDMFTFIKGVPVKAPLTEETKENAKAIKTAFKEDATHEWIQKFMKNDKYDILDNEGGGDCLFATIRDAYASIAQQTTTTKLRNKLAEQADDKIFLEYKEQYDMYNNAVILDTNNIKRLATEYDSLRKKVTDSMDKNERSALMENAKEIKKQHDRIVQEKKVSMELLKEFKIMKGVDTLDSFKKKIRTCEFWADVWAISTLERILNLKLIIFSSENYKNKDYANVLLCGTLADSYLMNKGVFQPEYYIIAEYTGNHYKLIRYKKRNIFTFPEIPYDIKKMIVDKCMERNSGLFDIIPEFKKFKNSLSETSSEKEEEIEDITEAKLRGLYTEDVIFTFYANSADKPYPGKGSGEKIKMEFTKEFHDLSLITEWRKKLTNSWTGNKFSVDNHKWQSVDHYYQASKFKSNHPEFYLSFSLDSGTELSKNVEMAKAAGSKSGKYKGKLIRPKEVEIDPEFYGTKYEKDEYDALFAKFSQNKELNKLLRSTKSAKLMEYVRGKPPVVFNNLMLVRDKLRETKE